MGRYGPHYRTAAPVPHAVSVFYSVVRIGRSGRGCADTAHATEWAERGSTSDGLLAAEPPDVQISQVALRAADGGCPGGDPREFGRLASIADSQSSDPLHLAHGDACHREKWPAPVRSPLR